MGEYKEVNIGVPTVPPSYPVAKALMLLEMKILTTLFNFSGPGWQSFPLSLTLSSSSGKDVHGCSKFFSLHFPISFFFSALRGSPRAFFSFLPIPFPLFFSSVALASHRQPTN